MPPSTQPHGERRLAVVLREKRREKNLTLNELGARLGLANGNFVGMVERGERVPSDQKLMEWARLLDLDERDTLELKYREQPGSVVVSLFGSPTPTYPYLREFLLATCLNRDEMEGEFARDAHSFLEDLIFQHLLQTSLLEPLLKERHPLASLRHHLQEYVRSRHIDPAASAEADWFDREGPSFVEFGITHLMGWSFDRPSLTLTVHRSRHPGDHFVIPLVEPRLREEVLRVAGREFPVRGEGPGLSSLSPLPTLKEFLRREGLLEADVHEIMDLIEWKKSRRRDPS